MKFEAKDITENTLLLVNDEGKYYVGTVETVDTRGCLSIHWKDLSTEELWNLNYDATQVANFLNEKMWAMAKNEKELLLAKLTLASL